ncbi:hypothetical protein HUB98_04015 [Paenibacillus barcinonensis]|uniref:Uncharacterized protein n=2 Tax=Paenibacillus TaxID=44249 RepID=A0A2V4VJQ7_PAEBA|nr:MULTISPECIES: hypothetical protein [Paenibacillus]MDM5277100.1 hypothetical protein [Paenibacillus silvae]PYE49354.1 hypothetical protein DFQ00_106340 [Paenibacillus barcinonensis]QKS55564.1 hypothetical protein HUB98_04015 [Paenibacillus barcinonensis]GGH41168.1 hypothetical protein GCM10008014_00520 [Paenibacillus silvae]
MEMTKNVRIYFRFGEPDMDDEDIHEVDLQISWNETAAGQSALPLDTAIQNWVQQNVSYHWEEVQEEE